MAGKSSSTATAGKSKAKKAPATTLDLGLAAVDITPQHPVPIAGYFYPRMSTGIHDPLHARTIIVGKGANRAVFVACEAIWVPNKVADEVRKKAAKELGIPQARIAVSGTHTHLSAEPTEAYERFLGDKMLESIRQAAKNTQPAQIYYGRFDEPRFVFNRRFFMKEGGVRTNPGLQNPGIICSSGLVDPEVAVLEFRDASGKPLAVWVDYALHLDTIGGTQFSADFPFFMGEKLKAALGRDLHVQFTIGPAGNINNFDVRQAKPARGWDEAQRIGEGLADGLLAARKGFELVKMSTIGAVEEESNLPPFPVSDEEVAWARKAPKETPQGIDFTLEVVKARVVAELDEVYSRKPIRRPVQSIALGSQVGIVMVPGELFAELGMDIKDQSPFPFTFVVEIANGYMSYLPTKTAFRHGGYETLNTRIAPGGGEKIVKMAVNQLNKLFDA